MRRFSSTLTAFIILLFFSTMVHAYPSHLASPRAVFDDGSVPQDMKLIQSFRNSNLEDYPSSSYATLGEKFDRYFGSTRWWNYDEYNVVMSTTAMIDGVKSKLRISFYREGDEPVWISYAQVDGETAYYWDRSHNKLDMTNLLRRVYALH